LRIRRETGTFHDDPSMKRPRPSLVFPLLGLATIAATLLTGCAIRSSAERRIDRNPDLYAELGGKQKELVRRGDVEEGMSRDAVYLAWGRPDMVRRGSREGRGKETWAYFDSTPITTASIGFGSYSGHPFYNYFGFHPRFGYGVGPGWTYGSGVDFVRHVDRTVEFVDGRVIAWERSR